MLLTTNKKCHCTEVATGDVLWRKVFLKNSQISQENTCVRGSFLIKLQALTEHLRTPRRLRALAALLKNILWHKCFPVIFVKFLRALFYRTPLGDCFCHTLVEYGDLSVNLFPLATLPTGFKLNFDFQNTLRTSSESFRNIQFISCFRKVSDILLRRICDTWVNLPVNVCM